MLIWKMNIEAERQKLMRRIGEVEVLKLQVDSMMLKGAQSSDEEGEKAFDILIRN